jgi:lycopene cyclase domain-containing protein
LTGFLTVLLIYIWADEFWFAAYNVADYPGESRKIPRLLQFHGASVVLGLVLIAAAIVYKKALSPAPEGFPGYFTFLVATALVPAAAFFRSARPFINWRAFSLTLFIVVLISLIWEATLALPYGWWGFQKNQMIGLSIGAWYGLPIEEVGVWIAVSYATAIVFEIVKLWQASGKKAKQAFLGTKETKTSRQ